MSVRDEIARALRERCAVCGEATADSLLPIVERVAREAAAAAISDRHSESQERAIIDAIVRRVMEGGQ